MGLQLVNKTTYDMVFRQYHSITIWAHEVLAASIEK